MRAVVQRVSRAKVTVEGTVTGEIGAGLMILLGVGKEDNSVVAAGNGGKTGESEDFRRCGGENESVATGCKRQRAGRVAIHFVRRCAGTEEAELYFGGAARTGEEAL